MTNDQLARSVAHRMYCELGECHGDTMCFDGADESKKQRWIEAAKVALSIVRTHDQQSAPSNEQTAMGLLRELVNAPSSAFITSWQSTAAWQKQLDAAREFLKNN